MCLRWLFMSGSQIENELELTSALIAHIRECHLYCIYLTYLFRDNVYYKKLWFWHCCIFSVKNIVFHSFLFINTKNWNKCNINGTPIYLVGVLQCHPNKVYIFWMGNTPQAPCRSSMVLSLDRCIVSKGTTINDLGVGPEEIENFFFKMHVREKINFKRPSPRSLMVDP